MTDSSATKNAWPNRQYGGNSDQYEEFETEMEAWTINNGYEEHLNGKAPERGDYTGTRAEARFEAALARDAKKGKEIWAKAIGGFAGDARKSAMSAEKHNARALFRAIKEQHGNKTDKQISTSVSAFNQRKLQLHEDIVKFNSEWKDGVRIMGTNGMKLPEPYLINLYLSSLGFRYRTLEAMVQVMPKEERTLAKVMRMAVDQSTTMNSGEADNRDVALYAHSGHLHPA